jgi:hypothetical protein
VSLSGDDPLRVARLNNASDAPPNPFDRMLRRRGFTGGLTQVPVVLGELCRGRYDIAHAYTPVDVQAALVWKRMTRRPVVFGCVEVLDRGNLADRRLRLQLLTRAVKETDAVVAHSEKAREALWRWLAVDAQLLDPEDGPAHLVLYRRLLGQT